MTLNYFSSQRQDMIGGEHSVRASMPYEELLVFTSVELPLCDWRLQLKCYLRGIFRATQSFSSRLLVPSRIQYEMVHQTHDNVLAARDVVNDRDPIEVDAQVVTDELGKDKKIKRRNAKLDDYV
ncbi:hypothetical protein KY290_020244 [Solanum tuberosum]|uniref:Uncharacterized protein n=2 Tax=Solanum tuberosum TaxID=4113 RepID=A0ABQ7UY77_SOLTU|nr:hypothetical protein KY289_019400 [Solanum tuberosum]KAH0756751.1 hypothetical protein KY290_020244 [Solanum tuberosum]